MYFQFIGDLSSNITAMLIDPCEIHIDSSQTNHKGMWKLEARSASYVMLLS